MFNTLIEPIEEVAPCGAGFCSCKTCIYHIHVEKGRFKSCLTKEDSYVISCYRYIELNPVRAGMVAHPADYRWTSYRANGVIFIKATLINSNNLQ